jgi:hypothetical protein
MTTVEITILVSCFIVLFICLIVLFSLFISTYKENKRLELNNKPVFSSFLNRSVLSFNRDSEIIGSGELGLIQNQINSKSIKELEKVSTLDSHISGEKFKYLDIE